MPYKGSYMTRAHHGTRADTRSSWTLDMVAVVVLLCRYPLVKLIKSEKDSIENAFGAKRRHH